MAGFPMCADCAARVRRPGRPPLPRPDRSAVPTAGRGCAWSRPGRADRRTARTRSPRRGGCSPTGRSSPSRASAATTSPATPPTTTRSSTLRKRKQRGDKPFAVMVARPRRRPSGWSQLDRRRARRCSTGRSRPIVLLRRRATPATRWLADGGARQRRPRRDAALHAGAPPAARPAGRPAGPDGAGDDQRQPRRRADRHRRRRGAATGWPSWPTPGWPTTGRSTCRATTPSSGSSTAARLPVRRSRGHAPLPLDAAVRRRRPALAVGGDLKNTFCLAEGRLAWLSAHVGDMDDLATLRPSDRARRTWSRSPASRPSRSPPTGTRRTARAGGRATTPADGRSSRSSTTTRTSPPRWPSTASTAIAGASASPSTAPATATTAPSWGGEFLVADYGGVHPASRTSPTSPLPGGDAGVRNPCRMALSHLRAAGVAWDADLPVRARPAATTSCALLDRQLETGLALRADLQHGPALRRGRLARRRLPPGRVRGPGRDGARGARPGASRPSDRLRLRLAGRDDGADRRRPVHRARSSPTCARASTRRLVAARFHQAVVDLVVDRR